MDELDEAIELLETANGMPFHYYEGLKRALATLRSMRKRAVDLPAGATAKYTVLSERDAPKYVTEFELTTPAILIPSTESET